MGIVSQKILTMSDQNSEVVVQIRPDDLMAELGIKKDAYYAYLKYLSMKAEKDSSGSVYLTEEQANLVRLLRSHVQETGKMEGFLNKNGELAMLHSESMLDAATQEIGQGDRLDEQMEELIRAAAELKGQQLVMPQMVVRELANRMNYEDLPPDVQAKVDQVRESANPKFQPAQLAMNLLDQWRTRQSQNQAA